MSRRPGLARLAAALVLALAAAAPAGGGPPPRAPGGESLRTQREALGAVRRQLDEARQRASTAREREVSLLAELERIDRTLVKKRGEVAELDRRIAQLEADLARLEGRRGQVAEDTVVQQSALVARVRVLDRWRTTPGPPGWLAGAEVQARAGLADDLARVAARDAARLVAFDETRTRLAARRLQVSQGRRELVELRGAVLAERAQVNDQAARRRALLVSVRDDRAAHERMVRELEEAAGRLEALVRALQRRAAERARAPARTAVARSDSGPARPAPPAVGLGALRGQLPWPADGRVVAGFGRQVHPRFGTETIRHGLDIEAPDGAEIRAVHVATVLYRGWLKGYGNLVVLDHGEGYYTLYAHASEVLVDEGDRVRAGQRIARVGETGSVEGPRLYFEVRYQGQAQDPLAWLRGRSR